jgi:AcrR family transcriptional regulator
VSSNVRGRKTKSEILNSAWELISEKGAEVSVSQIASDAGISRQTIYLHFGSRGGLLVALVRWADQQFEIKDRFATALALPNAKERLTTTLHVWLEFVPKIFPVAKDLIRLRDTDAEAAAAWDDRMSDLRGWLLDLVCSLQRDGALKDHWTPDQAANFLWAQTSVQVWGLLTEDCDWSEAQVAEKLTLAVVDALLVAD